MKRGAAILMNSDMIQPEAPARGWVLAWLNLTPGVAEFWNDVADSLASRGYQLVAVIEHDRAEERTKLRFPHIVGELWSTVGIGLLTGKRMLAKPSVRTASIALECMRRDRYFWTDSPINGRLVDLAESGVAAIDALLEPAVNRRPPAAVIVWNCSGSSSHAVAELLGRRGVSVCFAERGPITPCIFLDRHGINGLSERVRSKHWIERWKSCTAAQVDAVEQGKRIAQLLASRRSQNWSPRAQWTLGSLEDAATPAPAPPSFAEPAAWSGRVVYFACIEPHALCADLPRCAELGLPFGDSYRAAEFLLRACRREGLSTQTVIKPHPLERSPERYNWICRSLGGRVTTNADVYEAVGRGDVIATTSESVAWLASMLGGRVLSLGLTPPGIAGAVEEPASQMMQELIEASSTASLSEVMRRALRNVAQLSAAELERRRRIAWACVANLAPAMCTRDESLQELGLSTPAHAAEMVLEIARTSKIAAGRSSSASTLDCPRSAIAAMFSAAEELGCVSYGLDKTDSSTDIQTPQAQPAMC